ncbi:MAG: sulfite exporter TauE/SafE family protein [Thermoleophilia bacterium]
MDVLEAVLAGIGAGMLAGVFGVGGGILFVPALVLVADLTQVEAAATSLAAMIPVAILGTWQNQRVGTVRWRAAILIGTTSAVGTIAGAVLAERLPEDVLRKAFAALLILTAARLARSVVRDRRVAQVRPDDGAGGEEPGPSPPP